VNTLAEQGSEMRSISWFLFQDHIFFLSESRFWDAKHLMVLILSLFLAR